MDVKAIRRYSDLLVSTVIAEADDIPSPFDYPNIRTKSFVSEKVYIIDVDKYEKKLLKPLLEDEGWGKKFTEEYIERSIRKILLRTYKEGNKKKNSRAQKYFTELVNEVENYSQKHIVYIPLANIQLRTDKLEIGDITLFNITKEVFENIEKQVEKVVVNKQLLRQWLHDLQNNVCAEYYCTADADRAVERAIEECQRVLELLRFAIHMMGQDHLRVTIGFLNEVFRYIQTIPALSQDGERLFLRNKTIGPLAPFILEQKTISRMEEIGIFKVANILKQEVEEGSFHETLLRGIRWFSNAQTQIIKENQFLNLMTCLETFLTTRATEKITQAVARGVAIVLETTQVGRISMQGRVTNLYNHRSSLSHGGRSAMLNTDLEELRDITGNFLARIIQIMDKLKTKKDLDDWIKTRELND